MIKSIRFKLYQLVLVVITIVNVLNLLAENNDHSVALVYGTE